MPRIVKKGKRTIVKSKRRLVRAAKPMSNRLARSTFPAIYYARHIYADRIVLPAASLNDVMTSYRFRANGMYDPDASGTGHQPLGFDELSAVYNHYEVLGSKIVVDFAPESTGTEATSNIICGIGRSDTNVTYASGDFNRVVENGFRTYKQITDIGDKCRLVSGYSQKKTFGKTSNGTDNQKGSATADPVEQSFLIPFVIASDKTALHDKVVITVRIEYMAKWTERKTMTTS